MKRMGAWIMLLSLLSLPTGAALAQVAATEEAIPEKIEGVEEGTPPGWHPLLRFSGNFALGQNTNVPGQVDGLNMNFGYLLASGIGYLSDTREHEWSNTLTAQLSFARTPTVDAWLKSLDLISLRSEYLYHFTSAPWIGPFVAFRLDTPMLPGYDVRPTDTSVLKLDVGETLERNLAGQPLDAEGNVINGASDRVEHVSAGRQIRLTGAFAPLTLRESVGLFLLPVDKPEFKADIRAGFGAWETFVRGGYVLEDDETTATLLELRRMQDSVQLGPEVGIALSGLYETTVIWGASARFMQPVYNNAETGLEGLDLLNMEFDVSLGLRLASWVSVDYTFKAYRQPLIVDAWQIQNGLFVTITFDIIGEEAPPPAPCPTCPTCPEPTVAAPTPTPTAATEPAPAAPPPEPATAPEPAPAAPVNPT